MRGRNVVSGASVVHRVVLQTSCSWRSNWAWPSSAERTPQRTVPGPCAQRSPLGQPGDPTMAPHATVAPGIPPERSEVARHVLEMARSNTHTHIWASFLLLVLFGFGFGVLHFTASFQALPVCPGAGWVAGVEEKVTVLHRSDVHGELQNMVAWPQPTDRRQSAFRTVPALSGGRVGGRRRSDHREAKPWWHGVDMVA